MPTWTVKLAVKIAHAIRANPQAVLALVDTAA
jgi:hypothetical protein